MSVQIDTLMWLQGGKKGDLCLFDVQVTVHRDKFLK